MQATLFTRCGCSRNMFVDVTNPPQIINIPLELSEAGVHIDLKPWISEGESVKPLGEPMNQKITLRRFRLYRIDLY